MEGRNSHFLKQSQLLYHYNNSHATGYYHMAGTTYPTSIIFPEDTESSSRPEPLITTRWGCAVCALCALCVVCVVWCVRCVVCALCVLCVLQRGALQKNTARATSQHNVWNLAFQHRGIPHAPTLSHGSTFLIQLIDSVKFSFELRATEEEKSFLRCMISV